MKIRLERVEIDITSNVVDSVFKGVLALKQLAYTIAAADEETRRTMMMAIASIVTQTIDRIYPPPKTKPAAENGGTNVNGDSEPEKKPEETEDADAPEEAEEEEEEEEDDEAEAPTEEEPET